MKKYLLQIEKILQQAKQDGFEEGLQAARDRLNSPMSSPKVAGGVLASKLKVKRRRAKRTKASSKSGSTVEQQVLNYIGDNPGKTGAEIIRALSDLNSKTIRTMLRRLRIAEEISKEGEGWIKK